MKAPEGQMFLLKNGRSLDGLHRLKAELPKMHDDIFNHHVNEERNDFANWVQNSIQEIELAGRMRKAKNKYHMAHMVKKHIDENDKNIYESWSHSINNIIKEHGVGKSLKFKVWMSIFVTVSVGALFLFFSMLL